MLDIVKPEFTAEAQRAQRNLKRKREGDEEDEYLRSEVGSEMSSLTPHLSVFSAIFAALR